VPTLSSLLAARRDYVPHDRGQLKILLAAAPTAFKPTWNDLPCTIHEISEVRRSVPESTIIPLSVDDDVLTKGGITVNSLLAKLSDATFLHLACHGIHNLNNPFENGFVLRDGLLTISRLMAAPLPNAFLAFLSACETAQADKA
jgi:CHAT domain-containing protein